MRYSAMKLPLSLAVSVVFVLIGPISRVSAQNPAPTNPTPNTTPPATDETNPQVSNEQLKGEIDDVTKKVNDLTVSLNEQAKQTDFALVLGIGSLLNGGSYNDYVEKNNIISSLNLGRSSPQYLVGVSMRIPFQGGTMFTHHAKWDTCYPDISKVKGSGEAPPQPPGSAYCDLWRLHPWSAFLSLKFSPDSSQTLNGYVLGGTYQFAPYLSALVGFGLTPFAEPAYGFRVGASQYVAAQQKLGNLLNFDPDRMLANDKNAFDGFSLLDPDQKVIYVGTPLETHYRGGVVVGISIPFSFSNFLGTKTSVSSEGTSTSAGGTPAASPSGSHP